MKLGIFKGYYFATKHGISLSIENRVLSKKMINFPIWTAVWRNVWKIIRLPREIRSWPPLCCLLWDLPYPTCLKCIGSCMAHLSGQQHLPCIILRPKIDNVISRGTRR